MTALFLRLGWALVPPLAFLAVNASGKLARFVPSLNRSGDAGSTRGLWTFPLGVALSYAFFWSDPPRWHEYRVNGPFRLRHPYLYADSGGSDLLVTTGRGGAIVSLDGVSLVPPGDPEKPLEVP